MTSFVKTCLLRCGAMIVTVVLMVCLWTWEQEGEEADIWMIVSLAARLLVPVLPVAVVADYYLKHHKDGL